jgi:hypothetical protein
MQKRDVPTFDILLKFYMVNFSKTVYIYKHLRKLIDVGGLIQVTGGSTKKAYISISVLECSFLHQPGNLLISRLSCRFSS